MIQYYASDMTIYIKSDASYLSRTKYISHASSYHNLRNSPPNTNQPPATNDPSPPMNGAIIYLCKVMRKILSSASEAE